MTDKKRGRPQGPQKGRVSGIRLSMAHMAQLEKRRIRERRRTICDMARVIIEQELDNAVFSPIYEKKGE